MTSPFILLALVLAVSSATAADFSDDDYHEYILNDADTAQIDVLIVPPAAPDALDRLVAVEKSIDAWEAGIDALAAPWFKQGFDLDAYTLGTDVPTPAAAADPEILVISAEVNPVLLFGIGAGSDSLGCDEVDRVILASLRLETNVPLGPAAEDELPAFFHQHDGSAWAVARTDCADNTDNVCVVLNTNFYLTGRGQHDMYDLNAHEFGHCLGIGHVGDALDFTAHNFPDKDIMSYQETPGQVHCVSTLNMRSLEGVYAKVLGQPSALWLDNGDYYHMDPADYDQVNCANP